MTTVSFAFRPATVRGVCAHDCANGAALRLAACTEALLVVLAVADAASRSTAAAAPASSQRRLCIDSLQLFAPGARPVRRRLLSSTPRQGRPVTCRTTAP